MSSELFLTTANPAEIKEQLTYNSVEWRGPLTEEAYFRREEILANQDLTRSGGLTSWVLAKKLPDGSRKALCSCETLRKRALLALGSTGEVKEVTCYGVASVFTPPEYRGKGYASTMFRELEKWMDEQGKGKGGFSVLYSDIGKNFYAKHGWLPKQSAHVKLLVGESTSGDAGNVQWLTERDVPALCRRDESNTRARLELLARRGTNAVAICPDLKTLKWQQARESILCQELLGKTPDIQGALVKTDGGNDVWCYWTRWWYNPNLKEAKGNTLHILRLAVDDKDYDDSAATKDGVDSAKGSDLVKAVTQILNAAVQEARKWNMEDVQIWNPSSTTLAAARLLDEKTDVVHREKDSIASLRWCDESLKDIGDSVAWSAVEKYSWC
ncbi:Lysine acetyltransferase-like protein [Elsinoe fawcettii]|nr:Lysine acetyltransferase-like protein [Elsinoe fawcettii]